MCRCNAPCLHQSQVRNPRTAAATGISTPRPMPSAVRGGFDVVDVAAPAEIFAVTVSMTVAVAGITEDDRVDVAASCIQRF